MKRAALILCAVYFLSGGLLIFNGLLTGTPPIKLVALVYLVVAVAGVAGSLLGLRTPSKSMFALTAVAVGLSVPVLILRDLSFASPAALSGRFWFALSMTPTGAPVSVLGLDFVPLVLFLVLGWTHRPLLSPKWRDNIDQLTAILCTAVIFGVVGGNLFGLGGFILGVLVGVLAGTVISGAVVGIARRRRARVAESEAVAAAPHPAPAEPGEPEG